MGRIIISFSEDMFDIYLMGNGLFFRNWKKNSVKFITNQMQMNKMNFHLPVQQWQRRFAGVRYISICYWLSWHSMWLMQVLHYKPQWSVPIGTWIWKTIVVLGETFLTPFCLYTSFFFFFFQSRWWGLMSQPLNKRTEKFGLYSWPSHTMFSSLRPCWFLSVHLFVFLFQVRLKPMVFLEVT